MDTLEQKMGDVASTFKTSIKDVDKKAERMGKLKFIPKEDAVSIAGDLGALERKMQELNKAIAGLRSDMPRSEQILTDIEERLNQTSGALFTKQQYEVEELKKKVGAMESRVGGLESELEEEIERIRRQSGESEISRFLSELNESKKKITGLEEMKKEFETLKKRSASFNAHEMKENILSEFEKINSNLVESVEKKKNQIHQIEQETARLRRA